MATQTTQSNLPDLYIGKRPGRLGGGGFQAFPVEQLIELNSRVARLEALLERIADSLDR